MFQTLLHMLTICDYNVHHDYEIASMHAAVTEYAMCICFNVNAARVVLINSAQLQATILPTPCVDYQFK